MPSAEVIAAVESALTERRPAVSAAELAVQESLSSRERWAAWEARHGMGITPRGERPTLGKIREAGLNSWPKPSAHMQATVLHGAADTKQLHAPNGVYSAERKAVHDRIVSHFLEGHAPAKGQPEALFMAGGAASGKTHALKANPALKPKDAVEINPDAIKEHLPEYQHMVKHGDSAAAVAVHEESSDIAKRLLAEAQAKGHNVLVDGTGDSKRGKFAEKLTRMHHAGYKVRALYVTVPTHMAVERAVDRAHRTGRHVPIPEVEKQHANVSAFFGDVAALPFVHHLEVHDTSSGKSVKVASAAHGQLTIHHAAGYKAFRDKALAA